MNDPLQDRLNDMQDNHDNKYQQIRDDYYSEYGNDEPFTYNDVASDEEAERISELLNEYEY